MTSTLRVLPTFFTAFLTGVFDLPVVRLIPDFKILPACHASPVLLSSARRFFAFAGGRLSYLSNFCLKFAPDPVHSVCGIDNRGPS
jgi:hypothetical protein